MSNIKTILHVYSFNTRDETQAKQWQELRAKLSTSNMPHRMKSWSARKTHYETGLAIAPNGTVAIELETKCLFDNQWNTVPRDGGNGYRVFDWAQDYMPDRESHIKCGHWIEQTTEMREVRRNTVKCGYCGAQEPAAKGYVFCPHCLDTEYLKESDLYLTRMMPVSAGFNAKRAQLSDAERANLIPQYRSAQIHGNTERGRKRIEKARRDIEREYQSTIKNAKAEHDGKLWLMDHGVNTDNVIYYDHTGRFSFGWRQKLTSVILSQLLDIISEFPFPYDLECEDGRKLSGN